MLIQSKPLPVTMHVQRARSDGVSSIRTVAPERRAEPLQTTLVCTQQGTSIPPRSTVGHRRLTGINLRTDPLGGRRLVHGGARMARRFRRRHRAPGHPDASQRAGPPQRHPSMSSSNRLCWCRVGSRRRWREFPGIPPGSVPRRTCAMPGCRWWN